MTSIGIAAFGNCSVNNVYFDGNSDDWAKLVSNGLTGLPQTLASYGVAAAADPVLLSDEREIDETPLEIEEMSVETITPKPTETVTYEPTVATPTPTATVTEEPTPTEEPSADTPTPTEFVTDETI